MKPGLGSPVIGADSAVQRLDELRPFASTARLAMAVLCGLALWSAGRSQPWVWVLVGAFAAWSTLNLWRETTGRGGTSHALYFWSSALVVVGMVRGTQDAHLLVLLLMQPIMMVSLLLGVRQGMALGAASAAGLLIELAPPGFDLQYLLPAVGVAMLAPAMTLVARPMAALRQRVHLVAELERELDPRRGVQAVGLVIADRLRAATAAERVILCHRDAESATVLVSDLDEAAYAASPALASRLLALLADLPVQAMALDTRGRSGSRLTGNLPAAVRPATERLLAQVASLLEAQHLQLLPDAPGEPRSGWMLVAYGPHKRGRTQAWPLRPLAGFAVDMRRLVQQASYVDSLQAEIAAHERERIGRDLHDSALQPYLGLKFAIEGLAVHCTPDNPLHAQVQDLRRFCDAEMNELRETVSALRAGQARGDATLVPALRRQAKRFAVLLGIQTTLDASDELVTSRALSGEVLHMVNEALNNVRRHTRAQNVWVSLKAEAGALHLVVRDDAGQRSGQPAPVFAPRSLTERAHDLGGTLQLRRHQGLDTEIHITVPF